MSPTLQRGTDMRLSRSVYFYPTSDKLDFSEENFSSNAVLIDGPYRLLIDPGRPGRWPALKSLIEADGMAPTDITMIMFSHSHPDHLEAGRLLAEKLGAELALSEPEILFLKGGGLEFFPPADYRSVADYPYTPLKEGRLNFSGTALELILTPGHSPGGLSFYLPDENLLIVGDLYFSGTIGAVNYTGGCPKDMYASVARLETLAGVETVLCGHGPAIVGRADVLANYDRLNAEIAAKKAAGII